MNYYRKQTDDKTIILATDRGDVKGAIEAPRKAGRPLFTRSRVRSIPKGATVFTPTAFHLAAFARSSAI